MYAYLMLTLCLLFYFVLNKTFSILELKATEKGLLVNYITIQQ